MWGGSGVWRVGVRGMCVRVHAITEAYIAYFSLDVLFLKSSGFLVCSFQ